MNVNYNEISKIYDDVREEEANIIKEFLHEVSLNSSSNVLDIGCGTGNYTNIIQKLTQANVYGLDQSEGMLEKAKLKNPSISFVHSSALDTPFMSNTFDFIYMTDVIHHITDLECLFKELQRILKIDGKLCISTQSHRQIDLRAMSYFFPETSNVDKKRYPDIETIETYAKNNGLRLHRKTILDEGKEIILNHNYLELIEKKGYSMLHLISEDCYLSGLNKVKSALKDGPIKAKSAGATLVWFTKYYSL